MKKKRSLIIGGSIIAAAILFIVAKPADDDERLPFDVVSIKADSASEPDKVTFTDGSVMPSAGFDLELVGTLVLPSAKPVFLFKSFTCRACEPVVNLVVYTSENGEIHQFPFPGSHYLIGVEDSTPDLEDQIVDGVFGQCGGPTHRILLARKNREIESDGMSKRPSESWSPTFTTISFSESGSIKVSNETQDAFATLPALVSDQCLSIEPEDSHDYM